MASPISPPPFIEGDFFFPLKFLAPLSKSTCHMNVIYFWVLRYIILICTSLFLQIPCCFDYCSFVLLFMIAWAILGLLWFHTNLIIFHSTSSKSTIKENVDMKFMDLGLRENFMNLTPMIGEVKAKMIQ